MSRTSPLGNVDSSTELPLSQPPAAAGGLSFSAHLSREMAQLNTSPEVPAADALGVGSAGAPPSRSVGGVLGATLAATMWAGQIAALAHLPVTEDAVADAEREVPRRVPRKATPGGGRGPLR